MDKKQFIDQVIEQVRNLPVSSVLGTRMTLVRKGGYHKGLCPFHHDRTIGSFDANDRKKLWKCFSCGAVGDTVKFISLFDGINYLEAAFRIALDFKIISSWEFDEYYANRRYRKADIEKIQRRYEELDKEKLKSHIADDETLNRVFRLFIKSCDLSDAHKTHLMETRGLSEEEIANGLYFTFPTRKVLSKFCGKVRDSFGSEEVLSTIPGFYKEPSKKTPGTMLYTFSKHKGFGIGIKNAKGQVVGIQIRHDDKGDKSTRYVWFSSSFAIDDEKYEGGTSSGSPVDVVYPDEVKNTTVFVTEGRFKAEHIAKTTGSIAISVQGVTTWRGILKELEEIPKSPLLKKRFKGEAYRIHCLLAAFDSDMNYKYQVAGQLKTMTDHLEANSYYVYYLNWDEQFGRGIDDVLLSGNRREIKRYDKEVWDVLYENMLNTLLENEDEYDKLCDVPEEIVKKYFETYVKTNIKPLKANQLGKKHQLGIGK
ncbi:CHC2 zinc finger domain-containing protein [Brevibacillus sp. NPDC058079]|uniref:CHC2 zinc finger domain-containing protein n=1 Tax=Brevibacillus sp. NPDC058079 TaxID=3346330 RepID=UPI0036EC3E9E